MKLRNKLAVITAAAMLAFVGVGFASWAFTNSVQTQDVDGLPQITCAVELNSDFKLYQDVGNDDNAANDIEVPDLYLICDAPAAGAGLNALPGNGVYWSTANDATAYANRISGSEVYIKGTLNYDGYDIDDLVSVTVTFTAGDNYALANGTYVEFGAATLPAAVTVSGNDLVDGAEVKSAKFALPVPSYNSGVNSSNFNSVADVADITDGLAGLVVAYQAQITAKA